MRDINIFQVKLLTQTNRFNFKIIFMRKPLWGLFVLFHRQINTFAGTNKVKY